MGKIIGLVLAACLLAAPVQAESQPQSGAVSQQAGIAQPNRSRLYLILGGTVLGVTGMWLTLYRRGK